MGAAWKAWGDFSVMHQELEEMSRQNTEMLGLQVLQAKAASRSGLIEGPIFKVRFLEDGQIGLDYLKQL